MPMGSCGNASAGRLGYCRPSGSIVRCSRAKERWAGSLYQTSSYFQILLPLVSPFIDIMFMVGAAWYFIQK